MSAAAQTAADARKLTSPERELQLIAAIHLYLQDNDVNSAQNLLKEISLANLPASTRAEAGIASAEISARKGRHQAVLSILSNKRYGIGSHLLELPVSSQNRVGILRAEAFENLGDYLTAANERIFVGPMLPTAAHAANNDQIWADLAQYPPETLTKLAQETRSPDTAGWLSLISIYKQHQDDIDEQITALQNWTKRHPSHPASLSEPRALTQLKQLAARQPRQVALLLPRSGPWQAVAEAIERGFMTAYFQALKTRKNKTTATEIKIYDEASGDDFDAAYQQAVSDGADMIVGPLSKENVRRLYQRGDQLPVPTLTLNTSDLLLKAPNQLYQFGLSPEDDARSVALFAAAKGYQNAAILLQDSGEWGLRIQRAFTQQWEELGKTVLDTAQFKQVTEIESAVTTLLKPEGSLQRARQLAEATQETFISEPTPRTDLDFVFLITPGAQAQQVKPWFNFLHATQLPLLGGSYLYSGIDNREANQNLNGITFCDIPWVLGSPSPTRRIFSQNWPQANPRMTRLNALGVDAFRLATRLQVMSELPDTRLFGATGVIQLNANGQITRKLNWARFEGGQAIPLNDLPLSQHPAPPNAQLLSQAP
ncbi:LppC putative lipoprotein [gamma proteobacterium HdN1]|nr:LppC putative lipoprotein [gamma proteobacterium HdN1]